MNINAIISLVPSPSAWLPYQMAPQNHQGGRYVGRDQWGFAVCAPEWRDIDPLVARTPMVYLTRGGVRVKGYTMSPPRVLLLPVSVIL